MKFRKIVSIALLAVFLPSQAIAQATKAPTAPKKVEVVEEEQGLKLAGIFADQMVLQQNTEAAIWGKALPGEKVAIKASWLRSSANAKADSEGNWKATIRTPKAGGPFEILVKSGKESIELKNVLSGEVWICSGQSNMQWKMRGFGVDHFKEDVVKAKFPEIRFCDVPQIISLEKQDDVRTRWTTCSPKTVLNFSAVAYFFGSRLHEELDVPIGLISTNWGGSQIEGWISKEVLEKDLPSYEEQTKHYEDWIEETGALYPRAGAKPKGLNHSQPSVLFNSMIEPLMPFSFRGVIWYQGESNVKRPEQYRTLFPAMIRDWRSRWGIGDFPFYFVQIAPFAYKAEPIPVAFQREAQTTALAEPNTGMVVTMDIGDETNIHPKDKKPVGERLSLLALARTYGQSDLVDSGPIYKSMRVSGNKVELSFESIGSGLAIREGDELTHFTVAGKDKKFHSATAIIKGDKIIVESDEVRRPAAVRYGWGNADQTNLMNREGLPSPSFRTDDWPIEKKGGK